MDIKFTLQARYSGSQYIAGPFNLSGTTDTDITYELATNVSKNDLLIGYTVTTPYNITGGTIQSLGACISTPAQFYTLEFSNGPILVGNFDTYSGVPSSGIVKLTNLGYIDYSFDVGNGFVTGGKNSKISPYIVTMQSDGKVLVAGGLTLYDDIPCKRIIRLNPDGSKDNTFDLYSGITSSTVPTINVISCQPDGKILVGGSIFVDNYVGLIRLNIDGSVDNTFSGVTSGGFAGGLTPTNTVYSVLPLISGEIYVGGNFRTFNGTAQYAFILLNSDGTKNNLFVNGFSSSNQSQLVYDIKQDSYGSILIAGRYFGDYGGFGVGDVFRTNQYGSLDQNFDVFLGLTGFTGMGDSDAYARTINVQSDDKIVISGFFNTFMTFTSANNIIRILYDGTVDTSFTGSLLGFTGGGLAYPAVTQLLSDGSFFVTGGFTSSNGVSKNQIVKLNSDGTNDNSFIVATESYAISDVWQSYYIS
jgi:uncharacterized delta-60 repeat protein